jgi:hypothetical protein
MGEEWAPTKKPFKSAPAHYREGNGAGNRDAMRKLIPARQGEVLPDFSPLEIRQNEGNSRTETCPTILQS